MRCESAYDSAEPLDRLFLPPSGLPASGTLLISLHQLLGPRQVSLIFLLVTIAYNSKIFITNFPLYPVKIN